MKAVKYYFIVIVIPKEGLAGPQPANPSLGMTMTLRSVSRDPYHLPMTDAKIVLLCMKTYENIICINVNSNGDD